MLRLAPLALLILLAGCTSSRVASPSITSAELQRAVEAEIDGFEGVVGVYVTHLETGATAEVRPDELFPTASMIKVPIMVTVFDRIEAGEIGYSADVMFVDSLRYSEYDLFGDLRDSSLVPVHQLVELMLSASDNTSSLWLQAMVTGEYINEWLAANGFEGTRMNSRTEGRRGDWEVYGWGQTTPREMAELVRRIVEGEAVSPAADDEMHRALTRTFYDDEAVAQLPPWVAAATKQGAVSASKSEVAYVHAPSGPYVFCVVTKEQADTGYEADNAGFEIIRRLSRLFWQSFEPTSSWRPVPGAEQYRL
ncbi:MAG: serine hydrolase [Bacteroidota bacterium]